MTESKNEIQIRDWTALGTGRYRFYGSDSEHGGFYADVLLQYRKHWRVRIEGTNYTGDHDRLAGLVALCAEGM